MELLISNAAFASILFSQGVIHSSRALSFCEIQKSNSNIEFVIRDYVFTIGGPPDGIHPFGVYDKKCNDRGYYEIELKSGLKSDFDLKLIKAYLTSNPKKLYGILVKGKGHISPISKAGRPTFIFTSISFVKIAAPYQIQYLYDSVGYSPPPPPPPPPKQK